MRALFAEGRTVAEVAKAVGVRYGFAYGVAKRAGYGQAVGRQRAASEAHEILRGAARLRPKIPAPTLDDLGRARKQYRQVEPRDLFYRVATDLVGRARQDGSVLNLGEALAVLLYTWNRAFYQYHPPGPEHITALERLVASNRTLAGLRTNNLTSLDAANAVTIHPLFRAFEELLGPVGAAKALHLLAPNFFPIWDRRIAARYVGELGPRGRNAARYMAFMVNTAAQCRELQDHAGAPADLVKALDEWNYVRITRGLA